MVARRFALILCSLLVGCSAAKKPSVSFNQGDSIVVIGNTFAEQLQRYGFFETLLHCQFPEHNLRLRNLGWSADEIDLQPRPNGFADLHQDLQSQRADVVIACFGLNESFRGEAYLPRFRTVLATFLGELRRHQYNGKTAPRVVLVSPIAHETAPEHQQILTRYSQAMAAVAKQQQVEFVDLLTTTADDSTLKPSLRSTYNGIHLTQAGYRAYSIRLAQHLGVSLQDDPKRPADHAAASALRRAVVDKNRAFFQHWRGPDMEYIHGRHSELPGAAGLTEERAIQAQIVDQLQARITAAARPGPASVLAAPLPSRPLWASATDFSGLPAANPETAAPDVPPRYRITAPGAALDEFILADGYRINLFAAEANGDLANPVAMQFDTRGRLWVACSKTWPRSTPGRAASDSILILEDLDGDGKADRRTVFADQLPMIQGLALGDGGVYVAQAPDLIFLADSDGDDKVDRFETVLHGFGNDDAGHSINNLRWGPDGALYFMQGRSQHTQVETPQGPRRARDGALFRYHPHSQQFDVLAAHRFGNPSGQAFGADGQHLVLDGPSHDYLAVSNLAAPSLYPKRGRRTDLSFAPKGLGPAAGMELIGSRHFPAEVQGRLLVNQLAGDFRGTRWFELQPQGSGYQASQLETPLVFSTDDNCRPLAMTVGPDGALYLLDFASGLIENSSDPRRAAGRDHQHGRIWRVSYPERPLHPGIDLAKTDVIELLDMLGTTDPSTSRRVRRFLQSSQAEPTLAAVDQWLAGFAVDSPVLERSRLQALWIQQAFDAPQETLLRQVLGARTAAVRAAGLRSLRFLRLGRGTGFDALLTELVVDDDPRVRIEAILACGASDSPKARHILLQATERAIDPGIRHALDETLDYLEARQPPRPEDRLPEAAAARDYVISRMSNHELEQLAAEVPTGAAMAVFQQLAIRAMVAPSLRAKACAQLARLHKTALALQIYAALLATEGRDDGGAAVELGRMLAAAPKDQLQAMTADLLALTRTPHQIAVRQAGFAALLTSGESLAELEQKTSVLPEILGSIGLTPAARRETLFEAVIGISLRKRETDAVRGAAILALAEIPGHHARIFNSIIGEITQGVTEVGAQALLRYPQRHWQTALAARTLDGIFEFLEQTAARDRHQLSVKQTLRAGFELAQFQRPDQAAATRTRLRSFGTTAMTLRVDPSLMAFDKTEIVVKAGQRIELTLENLGTRHHNLVLVAPGKLAAVGALADCLIGASAAEAHDFVPDSEHVLAATSPVPPRGRSTLSFITPAEPGDYPFLCSIPGHWSQMHGILRVVAEGSIPPTVYRRVESMRTWNVEKVPHILKKRGSGKAGDGEPIFQRLCSNCHQLGGPGSSIGPDLRESATQVSLAELLTHTIAPDQRIAPRYQTHRIALRDGSTVFGRIRSETADLIQLVMNPVTSARQEIRTRDIIQRTPSRRSTMPTGLLDSLKRRQILDLMAYIRASK